jgi:hypothetical protein
VTSGAAKVPELRTVLVVAPTLLADLIRRVLADRVAITILPEFADPADIGDRLRNLVPDIVIIGPVGAVPSLNATSTPSRTRVLTLSADLTNIIGPDPDDIAPFTPEILAARVRDILAAI